MSDTLLFDPASPRFRANVATMIAAGQTPEEISRQDGPSCWLSTSTNDLLTCLECVWPACAGAELGAMKAEVARRQSVMMSILSLN